MALAASTSAGRRSSEARSSTVYPSLSSISTFAPCLMSRRATCRPKATVDWNKSLSYKQRYHYNKDQTLKSFSQNKCNFSPNFTSDTGLQTKLSLTLFPHNCPSKKNNDHILHSYKMPKFHTHTSYQGRV